MQNKGLEYIDLAKNYQGKLAGLSKELRIVNKKNREVSGQILDEGKM